MLTGTGLGELIRCREGRKGDRRPSADEVPGQTALSDAAWTRFCQTMVEGNSRRDTSTSSAAESWAANSRKGGEMRRSQDAVSGCLLLGKALRERRPNGRQKRGKAQQNEGSESVKRRSCWACCWFQLGGAWL